MPLRTLAKRLRRMIPTLDSILDLVQPKKHDPRAASQQAFYHVFRRGALSQGPVARQQWAPRVP